MGVIVDSPINRTNILELSVEELQDFVSELQERRLRSYNIYQEAQKAKQERDLGKREAEYSKLLDRFVNKHQSVLKGLEVLEKTALDILALRMALGHKVL